MTAAVALVAHYLNSDEGKVLISKVKKDAFDAGDNLSSLGESLVRKGKTMLGVEPGLSYGNNN